MGGSDYPLVVKDGPAAVVTGPLERNDEVPAVRDHLCASHNFGVGSGPVAVTVRPFGNEAFRTTGVGGWLSRSCWRTENHRVDPRYKFRHFGVNSWVKVVNFKVFPRK